jgi:hypothetical protein
MLMSTASALVMAAALQASPSVEITDFPGLIIIEPGETLSAEFEPGGAGLSGFSVRWAASRAARSSRQSMPAWTCCRWR